VRANCRELYFDYLISLARSRAHRPPRPAPSLPAPRSPRFNVVSPGADEEIYFPCSARERRLTALHPELEALVYGAAAEGASVGQLEDRSKPLLFSMARLDKEKNLTGLVAWFGASPRLRAAANLLIVGEFSAASLVGQSKQKTSQKPTHHSLITDHYPT